MKRHYCWDDSILYKIYDAEVISTNTRAAELGIPEAQIEMGIRSYVGDLVERSRAAALDWFGKAAAQGNADACYNLGICHAYGRQDEINYSVAVDYFKWAANLGCLEAAAFLVEFHSPGKWARKDAPEVAKWYRMLCRRDPKALEFKRPVSPEWQDNPEHYAAPCNWLRIAADAGVKEAQYSRNYDWRKMAADLGNAKALCDIGVDLIENPTDDDWVRAFELFTRAADLGEPSAFFNVGKCLMDGIGVEVDKVRALSWFEKARDSGYKSVQPLLADCYLDGIGCEADAEKAIAIYKRNLMTLEDRPKEAFLGVKCGRSENGGIYYCYSRARRWVELLAGEGDAGSQYEMGLNLSHSSDRWQKEKESREAVSWFRKAAEQGHAEAENELGECYRDGHGVERDLSEAVRWFEKAAEQNNPKALFNLGFHYYAGNGVQRDWKKAKELLERAVEMDKDGWRAGDKAKECLRNMGCLP